MLYYLGHGADVKCVDWHPSKSIIASGSKDSQQPLKLWDPKSGISLATMYVPKLFFIKGYRHPNYKGVRNKREIR